MIQSRSLLLICMLTFQTLSLSAMDELQIHVRDGSILSLQPEKSEFVFYEAGDDAPRKRSFSWSDTKSLLLVKSPVSKRTQQIEQLLQQLKSTDYEARERAESALSDSKKFGPFESLIRDAASALDLESDYRLQRILSKLESYNGSIGVQLDELTLKDGTVVVGDARGISINGEVLGQKIRLDRNRIVRVFNKRLISQAQPSVAIKTQTFNQPIHEFYNDESESIVSFEVNKNGEPIPPREDAGKLFVDQGLKLTTENQGRIETLRYGFKFNPDEIETGLKCICPIDPNSSEPRRPHGTTIISFCLPGMAGTPAGVHKFGLLIEKVDHSRDIVVEAYNAIGQMIGMVEASDQLCVFAGFKSSELITSIRVSRNNDLPDLERFIDTIYVLDCLTFDDPIAVDRLYDPSSRNDALTDGLIEFELGQLLSARNLKFSDTEISFASSFLGKTVAVERKKLKAIRFRKPIRRTTRENDYLMVQLKNGSIVKTDIESYLDAFDFLGSKLPPDQVVGIWGGSHPARLAEQSDFVTGKPVMVWPSCRIIVEDLKLGADKFKWDSKTSKKIVQNVKLYSEDSEKITEKESEDPDFTPDVDSVNFKQSTEIPTLWLSQPRTHDNRRGHVLLTDGQYFVLEGTNGFRLGSIDDTSIEVSFGDSRKKYPMTRVSSIKFP